MAGTQKSMNALVYPVIFQNNVACICQSHILCSAAFKHFTAVYWKYIKVSHSVFKGKQNTQ